MTVNDRALERTFRALANKRRLRIIKYLQHGETASVGELAEAIHLPFKATSQHLRLLESADVVEHEKRGTLVIYKLAPAGPLLRYITARL